MSRKDKLIQKLMRKPPPTDFSWEELITLLRRVGFKEHCEGGSHYTFDHPTGFSFGVSKTHPDGIMKRYQIKSAIEALSRVGHSGEDE